MIARILYGSLRRRFQPLAAIALSATVAAGTLAAAAGRGARLEAGAAADLHASGPNLLVRPQVGGPEGLPASEVAQVAATPGVLAAAGLALVPRAALLVGGSNGAPAVVLTPPGEGRLPVLAATEALFELRPRWEVARSRTVSAEPLRLTPGAAFLGAHVQTTSDRAPKGARVLPAAGTVATGEAVDGGVVVPLSDLPRTVAAGTGGSSDRILDRMLDRIEVRADPARLEEVARAIEARVPGAEARPLRHVTATEAGVVHKLQLLMLGVGAICLLLALATVGSATLALLDERRREMALFLSLGYTGRWIQGLMSAELAFVGLVSVLAGGLAGEAAAALLARSLLDGLGGAEAVAGFRPSIAGIAAGVVVVALLVALATALVRFRVERLDPAPVLHGR